MNWALKPVRAIALVVVLTVLLAVSIIFFITSY